MRMAVGALVSRTSDDALRQKLEEALAADSIPTADQAGFVWKATQVKDLLSKSEGKQLAATTSELLVPFTSRLAEVLMDDLTNANLSEEITRGLDLWGLLLNFGDCDSAPDKMFNLAVATQKLACQINAAAQRTTIEDKNAAVHNMGVLEKQAAHDLRSCGDLTVLPSLFRRCGELADETIRSSQEFRAEHSRTVLTAAAEAAEQQRTLCLTECRGLESRDPSKVWHAGARAGPRRPGRPSSIARRQVCSRSTLPCWSRTSGS